MSNLSFEKGKDSGTVIFCHKTKCLVLPDNPRADFTGLTPESLNFDLPDSNPERTSILGLVIERNLFLVVVTSCHLLYQLDSQELLIQQEDRIFYRRACDRGDNRKYRLSATAARPEPVQVLGPRHGPRETSVYWELQ